MLLYAFSDYSIKMNATSHEVSLRQHGLLAIIIVITVVIIKQLNEHIK